MICYLKWEEFKKMSNQVNYEHLLLTDIECPICGKKIYKDTSLTLISYPPQYKYKCIDCGWTGTAYQEKGDAMEEINVMLDEGAYLPVRAHEDDAGLDLFSPIKTCIWRGETATIDTGVHVGIPKGYVGMLKSKSGLNVKYGISGEGVIDAGYTGSIVCKLYNNSIKNFHIEKGDKIIQLVIIPIVTPQPVIVDSFEETERGDNGFGSTGR